MKTKPHSLFELSLQMFWMVTVITLIAVSAVGIDLCLRARFQDAAAADCVAALGISWTALTPAGTLRRHPEAAHLGVDLRYTPGLPHKLTPMGFVLNTPRNCAAVLSP